MGSEGTLGLATQIMLKLERAPEAVKTMLAIYDTIQDGANTVSAIIAEGIVPATLEMMDNIVMRAVEETECRRVLLGGGVSANRRLKAEIEDRLGPEGRLFHASPRLSLDNGAMVARAGVFRLERGDVASPEVSADANLPFPNMVRRLSGSRAKD